MAIVTCQVCKSNFKAKRNDAKYCSFQCKKTGKRSTYSVWASRPEVAECRRTQNTKRMREFRANQPERHREQYRTWYEAKGIEYHKQWRESHPEYRKRAVERATKRNKDNPDEKKRFNALYYQRHKERVRVTNESWRKANPERSRAIQHASLIRYRSRLANASGNWTHQQFKDLCEAVNYYCAYCHKQFDKLTADHIIPLSRGGSNDISNIIPACGSCNYSKRDKTPLEYLIKLQIS